MAAKKRKYGDILGTQSPLRFGETMGGGGGIGIRGNPIPKYKKTPSQIRTAKTPPKTDSGKAEGASKKLTPEARKVSKTPTSTVKEYNKPPKKPLKKVEVKKKVKVKKESDTTSPKKPSTTKENLLIAAAVATPVAILANLVDQEVKYQKKSDFITRMKEAIKSSKSVPVAEVYTTPLRIPPKLDKIKDIRKVEDTLAKKSLTRKTDPASADGPGPAPKHLNENPYPLKNETDIKNRFEKFMKDSSMGDRHLGAPKKKPLGMEDAFWDGSSWVR